MAKIEMVGCAGEDIIMSTKRKENVMEPSICFRCTKDLQPKNFGTPRLCAFDGDGNFHPDNWNCATLEKLLDVNSQEFYGNDESMEIISVFDGWVILNRYKQRGKCSSAVWVGDWWPARCLTLECAERIISKAGGGTV